jgi:hypothetical protein
MMPRAASLRSSCDNGGATAPPRGATPHRGRERPHRPMAGQLLYPTKPRPIVFSLLQQEAAVPATAPPMDPSNPWSEKKGKR